MIASLLRSKGWVSKSDIIRFDRCQYAWWAFEHGKMEQSPLAVALLERGNRIEGDVVASPDRLDPDLSTTAEGGKVAFGSRRLEDRRRRIYGIPDGTVSLPDGMIAALEVKSHRQPRATDDLELAFYSLLLSGAYGTTPARVGFLVTVGLDGVFRLHRRELDGSMFDQVNELIKAVRESRRRPPTDTYCGCQTCKARLKDERERQRLERNELTMLWNLGRATKSALAEIGINTIAQLPAADPVLLQGRLAELGRHLTVDDVRGWQAHADAYRTGDVVIFDELSVPEPPYYLLDTEYDTHDPNCPIFLVALGAVDHSGELAPPKTWWAPTPALERDALLALKSAVAQHPTWPIVTWNGHGADLPMLSKAQHRLEIEYLVEELKPRHVDLFIAVKAAVRFPSPHLELKTVESYAGVERLNTIADAQTALATYRRLRRQRPDGDIIGELRMYAGEDVIGLAELIIYLRILTRRQHP